MSTFAIPALGFLCAFLGITFLIGCFVRVDSPRFIDRASGNKEKIERLRSLQASWDKIGKLRQFFASASGYLIMAAGLLLVWLEPRFAKFFWIVPALYLFNLLALLAVKRYAMLVVDQESPGGSEALRVIKQHIYICFSFSVVYVVLVAVN